MKLQLNKVHFPVTTLGYGRRLGIWTQGCSIRCPGCINRDTWDPDPTTSIDVDVFLARCAAWLRGADGVTISGGEPFDQPEALEHLLALLRQHVAGDLLVYSGYPGARLFQRYQWLSELVDVLISEPYDARAGQSLCLRGSDNQRIWLLSELARRRYPNDIDGRRLEGPRRLDVCVGEADVWFAGIPAPGMLAQLQRKLVGKGYNCTTTQQPMPRVLA
jgi:anaerobic ribonucleoside-triphosphate reductase activating protein